jgi:ubiquinone/menaquinone biosynthesis C-methylase UbiE
MTSWWLDEHDFAGPEHLDDAYVAGYERKAGYHPAIDIEALRRHGLDRRSTVLDIGAGPGTFAFAVAPECSRVIAADVSPAMTAVLRRRATASSTGNVSVVEAGFLSYAHSGPPVDFVFSRNALHQIPDFWKAIALARLATVLAPGGVMRLLDLVYDFEPADAPRHIEAWIAGAHHDAVTGYVAEEFATHVRTEHGTFRWLLEPMLEHTGFEILDVSSVRSIYATYTCRLRGA